MKCELKRTKVPHGNKKGSYGNATALIKLLFQLIPFKILCRKGACPFHHHYFHNNFTISINFCASYLLLCCLPNQITI